MDFLLSRLATPQLGRRLHLRRASAACQLGARPRVTNVAHAPSATETGALMDWWTQPLPTALLGLPRPPVLNGTSARSAVARCRRFVKRWRKDGVSCLSRLPPAHTSSRATKEQVVPPRARTVADAPVFCRAAPSNGPAAGHLSTRNDAYDSERHFADGQECRPLERAAVHNKFDWRWNISALDVRCCEVFWLAKDVIFLWSTSVRILWQCKA